MSNSTRKLIAGVLVVLIVWPLAFGALTLLAINSWILDRNFYVNLLDDSSVYDPLLSQDFPQYVNSRWFPQQINSDLPPAALDKALREVMATAVGGSFAIGNFAAALGIAPWLADITPWGFLTSATSRTPSIALVALGRAGLPLRPIVATVIWCVLFTAIALWRFGREEF